MPLASKEGRFQEFICQLNPTSDAYLHWYKNHYSFT